MSIDLRRAAVIQWVGAKNTKKLLWERARTGTPSDHHAAIRSDAAVDAALQAIGSLYGLNWVMLGASLQDTDKVDEIMKFLEIISSK